MIKRKFCRWFLICLAFGASGCSHITGNYQQGRISLTTPRGWYVDAKASSGDRVVLGSSSFGEGQMHLWVGAIVGVESLDQFARSESKDGAYSRSFFGERSSRGFTATEVKVRGASVRGKRELFTHSSLTSKVAYCGYFFRHRSGGHLFYLSGSAPTGHERKLRAALTWLMGNLRLVSEDQP